jgi:hypothetical protein
VIVKFTNTTGGPLPNVVFTVQDNGPITPDANGSLAYIPGQADGGYVVASIANNAKVERLFAIKPLDAEAGKRYSALATVGSETQTFEIFVEARPEVYAAIGAAERMRQTLLGLYDDFKQTGRTVHEETALPTTDGEAANEALQPSSFQWAMSAVEMVTRTSKSQRGKSKIIP